MGLIKITMNSRALQRRLDRMTDAAQNLTDAMRQAAGIMQESTDLALRGEYDPVTGAAWPALSPQYAAQRAEAGHSGKMLQVSGQLKNSISRDYGRDYARVGSNYAFAAVHQFGARTRPHTIRARNARALRIPGVGYRRSVNHPGSVIPQRRFLGMGREDVREISKVLLRHVLR